MTVFLGTIDDLGRTGLINAAHVREIVKERDPGNRKTTRIVAVMDDDSHETLDGRYDDIADVENLLAPVVPAQPGFYRLDAVDSTAPEDDGLYPCRTPIVAWRIAHQGATPITFESDGSNGDYAVLYPNGVVCEWGNQNWKNEAEWIADKRAELKAKSKAAE
jgi:hypothetical protein